MKDGKPESLAEALLLLEKMNARLSEKDQKIREQQAEIKILNERYKFNDDIKFKVVNGYVEKKKKINKQRLHEVLNEYPFIFDKSEKLENKVMYFIKKRYEYDINCNSVREILYDDNEEV